MAKTYIKFLICHFELVLFFLRETHGGGNLALIIVVLLSSTSAPVSSSEAADCQVSAILYSIQAAAFKAMV